MFLLLDIHLDGAISFIEKVVATFYDPPPYILAANVFNCSLEKSEILNLGADVCLEKPFDHQEILAILNAVLRRADRLAHPKPFYPSPQIECGTLTIDPMRRPSGALPAPFLIAYDQVNPAVRCLPDCTEIISVAILSFKKELP